MGKKKGFIAEFKEFALKGNVTDMAIGIIIGAAFTAIVTSLVEDIITPLLSIVLGHINVADLSWNISQTLGISTETPIILAYGGFLQAIINFLLVAVSIFIIIKIMNKSATTLRKPAEVEEEAPAPPAEDIVLLTEIRDLLQNKQS